jgi:hypothetical protein
MGFIRLSTMIVLVLAGLTIGHQAQAGFEVLYKGQQTKEAAPQPPVQAAPPAVKPDTIAPPQPKEPVKIAGTSAPALQVFNDRYVPDDIRKKYNLDDTWYGTQPVKTTEAAPKEVAPIALATPTAPIAITPVDVPAVAAEVASAEAPKPAPVFVDTWRARKGESLRDVLKRWSDRASANLMWASPETPNLQDDFSFVGKYQDAVNALIKENGSDKIHSQYRSEGINPIMMTPASTVTTNAPQGEVAATPMVEDDRSTLSRIFKPAPPQRELETKWFGLSGAPLAEVVQVWADDAGVKLVWQADKNFALKKSISQVGQFENAVFEALSQYEGEPIRPVGEMYQDPKTGEKVLLVRNDTNS